MSRDLASLYDSRFLQGYVRSKTRRDPVYAAVAERLRGHPHPLVDAGCGIGILALYLREHGFAQPITGIDFDPRKVAAARKAVAADDDITITQGDVRDPFPANHSVTLLDVLHYFDEATQTRILANAALAVPPGGMLFIRDCIRDDSWRYRVTVIEEMFARAIRWLRSERLHFPTRERIVNALGGFDVEVVPMWGGTPFNNYLFAARRRPE